MILDDEYITKGMLTEESYEGNLDMKEMAAIPNKYNRNKNTPILLDSVERDNDHSKSKFNYEDGQLFSCTFCHYKINIRPSFDSHMTRNHGEKRGGPCVYTSLV